MSESMSIYSAIVLEKIVCMSDVWSFVPLDYRIVGASSLPL